MDYYTTNYDSIQADLEHGAEGNLNGVKANERVVKFSEV